MPDLLRQHVHQRLGEGVHLRSAEAPVGCVEGVVGHAAPGQRLHIGDAVAVEGNGNQVVEDLAGHAGIGAVIQADVDTQQPAACRSSSQASLPLV